MQPQNREILLGDPGGPEVTIRILQCIREKQRSECQNDVLWEGPDGPLLALKTKEGATQQGVQVPIQAGKGKEVGSRLDPPEMDTAMLTPPLQLTENHSDL